MINKVLLLALISVLISCNKKNEIYSVGQIKTPQGEILIWLYDETPNHKEGFTKLAITGYFDSLTFNRVIKDFVAQGGCPDTPEGFSRSPYLLQPEFVDTIKHVYGAVAAGRDDNPGKLSAICQFYIVQNKNGLARLDGNYTVFGQVFKGMDVIDAIVSVEKDSTDRPITPVTLDVNIIDLTADELKNLGYTVK